METFSSDHTASSHRDLEAFSNSLGIFNNHGSSASASGRSSPFLFDTSSRGTGNAPRNSGPIDDNEEISISIDIEPLGGSDAGPSDLHPDRSHAPSDSSILNQRFTSQSLNFDSHHHESVSPSPYASPAQHEIESFDSYDLGPVDINFNIELNRGAYDPSDFDAPSDQSGNGGLYFDTDELMASMTHVNDMDGGRDTEGGTPEDSTRNRSRGSSISSAQGGPRSSFQQQQQAHLGGKPPSPPQLYIPRSSPFSSNQPLPSLTSDGGSSIGHSPPASSPTHSASPSSNHSASPSPRQRSLSPNPQINFPHQHQHQHQYPSLNIPPPGTNSLNVPGFGPITNEGMSGNGNGGLMPGGPGIHIVPATPISGGGAAKGEPVPFQTTLNGLTGRQTGVRREDVAEGSSHLHSRSPSPRLPVHSPRPQSQGPPDTRHVQLARAPPSPFHFPSGLDTPSPPSAASYNQSGDGDHDQRLAMQGQHFGGMYNPQPPDSPSPSPSPHLGAINYLPNTMQQNQQSFLIPGAPPRTRSKSDTSLQPPQWSQGNMPNGLGLSVESGIGSQNTVGNVTHDIITSANQSPLPSPPPTAYLQRNQQQPLQQLPPHIPQSMSFGPPASGSGTGGVDINMPDYLTAPVTSPVDLRRAKSESNGHRRGARSEDLRRPFQGGFGSSMDMGSAGIIYDQQQNYMGMTNNSPGVANHTRSTSLYSHGGYLSAGNAQIPMGGSHPGTPSLGAVNLPMGVSVSGYVASDNQGMHRRTASSGSAHSDLSYGGLPHRALSRERGHGHSHSLSHSRGASPYPSPHASPRIHANEQLPGSLLGDNLANDLYSGMNLGLDENGMPINNGLMNANSMGLSVPGNGGVNNGMSDTVNVSRPQVTSPATEEASRRRRRTEANFACPVPGCGSTFTRHFNLKGHLRSHNEERPFKCKWPGCNKGFARQHDCKRHEQLHLNIRPYVCRGCERTFARMDALNRHLRSDAGTECQSRQPLLTHDAPNNLDNTLGNDVNANGANTDLGWASNNGSVTL